DWRLQKSSSHAIADDAGQPEPAYTAILESSCWPHVRTPAVPLNEAVHANQRSLAMAVVPLKKHRFSLCPCDPAVGFVTSYEVLPRPVIDTGAVQESFAGGIAFVMLNVPAPPKVVNG